MRRRIAAVAVLALAAAGALAGCGPSGPVTLSAVPRTAPEDAPVTTTVTGLSPGAAATVTATARDRGGRAWSSSAAFTADDDGRISLAQQANAGSYRGRDAMGLFETLAPTPHDDTLTVFDTASRGYDVTLRVAVDGRTLATTTVRRQRPDVAGLVTKRALRPRDSGVYGSLYLPAHPVGRRPAVLTFGGSEGGVSGDPAADLAAHGYPALALAYFGEPGIPRTLTNIPLEYFVTALKLLAAQPGVDPGRIYTLGASRGSEAALLLGAHFPQLVHGVVATSPSSVVNGSEPPGTAGWTLGGRPLPFAPLDDGGNPNPVLDAPQAIIPVRDIHGPVVFLCGAADRIWSSCAYAQAAVHRRPGQPTTLLRYPAAGHFVDLLVPYLPYAGTLDPVGARTFPTGGSVLANQQADAQAWPRILAILGGH